MCCVCVQKLDFVSPVGETKMAQNVFFSQFWTNTDPSVAQRGLSMVSIASYLNFTLDNTMRRQKVSQSDLPTLEKVNFAQKCIFFIIFHEIMKKAIG